MVLRAVVGANSGGGSGTGSFATTTGQPSDNTALANVLGAKAPLASPTFTGIPRAPTAAQTSNDTQLATTGFVKTAIAAIVSSGNATWGSVTGTLSNQTDLVQALAQKQNLLPVGNTTQYIRGDGSLGTLTAGSVGLANVNNTADVDKPLSTAAQSALNQKAPVNSPVFQGTPTTPTPPSNSNDLTVPNTAWVISKVGSGSGSGFVNPMTTQGDLIVGGAGGAPQRLPNGVNGQIYSWQGWLTPTKTLVGLSNVDNTSDASKPVSTAQAAAIGAKASLASPAFTGTPTAPKAASGVSTGQIATTSFVSEALALFQSLSTETAALALVAATTATLKAFIYTSTA